MDAKIMDAKGELANEIISLEYAYNLFNEMLFDNELEKDIVLLIHRHKRAAGYFRRDGFTARSGDGTADEIALNPLNFSSDEEIFSTLAHEMAHKWQYEKGKPPKNGAYHNKQWAEKMLEIGLKPYNIKKPELMTGERVSDTIIPGGKLDKVLQYLTAEGLTLDWKARPEPENIKRKKQQQKIKYICGVCQAKVWGKPGLNIGCMDCSESMEPEI